MNPQEKIWFEQLKEKRKSAAKTFMDDEYRGIWDRIVDMYKESAHFVYELLQNADDAGATEASFELLKDRLLFRHNGSKRFSISNPDSYKVDKENGNLGCLNSITAAGFSNKNSKDEPGNSIGKFGIGFKSVFIYTASPQIYDPSVYFQITDYIVPEELNDSYAGWNGRETLFVLPFNKREKSPEKSYSEIRSLISGMNNPALFLNNLKKVSYIFSEDSSRGEFVKTVEKEESFEGKTNAELVTLSGENFGQNRKLWLFSRQTRVGKISVGFGFEGGRLVPLKQFANCFFETKEDTHLNFVIHAPFLLTPDRQHIKENEEHNQSLIAELAELAADCFVYLQKLKVPMGNEILEIVPIHRSDFWRINYQQNKLVPNMFTPFYEKILEKFKIAELLPTRTGSTTAANAYRPVESGLQNVFSDADLSMILGKNSFWVFPESKSQQYLDSDKKDWIQRTVGNDHLFHDRNFLNKISKIFVEKKFAESPDWFLTFYQYMADNRDRTYLAKGLPIFIDQAGKAVRAFDGNAPQLFLSTEGVNDYPTIHERLYGLRSENFSVEEFCQNLKIVAPSLKVEIETKILPRYSEIRPADEDAVGRDFQKILRYCLDECSNAESENVKTKLKEQWLVRGKKSGSDEIYWMRLNDKNLYFDSPVLREWFSNSPDIVFLDLPFYSEMDERGTEFFKRLGIFEDPRRIKDSCSEYDNARCQEYGIKWGDVIWEKDNQNKISISAKFNIIQGMKDFVKSEFSLKRSQLFGLIFLKRFEKWLGVGFFDAEFSYQTSHLNLVSGSARPVCRPTVNWLRNQKWILTKKGEWKSPNEIFEDDISDDYNAIPDWRRLVDWLEIRPRPHLDIETLPPEIRNNLDELDKLKNLFGGILPDEARMRRLLELEQREESREQRMTRKSEGSNVFSDGHSRDAIAEDDGENSSSEIDRDPKMKILKRVKAIAENPDSPSESSDETLPDEEDPSFDSEKEIQKAERKLAAETNLIAAKEKACREVCSSSKYSFGWFKAMLKLEILNGTKNAQKEQKEISIQFGQVSVDKESRRTLILSRPNKRIPAAVENLYDMNLRIRFCDGSERNLTFEAASIRSFSLRLKMMRADDLQNLDTDNIEEASIVARSPEFLLQELQTQFRGLPYEDDFDMHQNLCENIRFIFGPPGTGKTTYLVEKELLPLVADNAPKNILVLAPTNKAADVLTRRLMENSPEYQKFLTRFGTTEDCEIEKDVIFCGRGWDVDGRKTNIVVTTIARLPYDSSVVEGSPKRYLRDIPWNVIVVDEASMIPLIQIAYLLYSQKDVQQFVIAGDPFQISPMFSERSWQKENIYTMVGLDKVDSFKNPQTSPRAYQVVRLQRQYRSIPEIGDVFSRLTYGGLLEHDRSGDSRKRFVVNGKELDALNIIKFPVSTYESIYCSKKLKSSPYHIYSALFAYEYVRHLVTALSGVGRNRLSVGVVSPYRIQADLIENLLMSWKKPVGVSVHCGTVHRFQGDECDVMFVVLNPPAYISDKSFLNQVNLINVAVSRARDSLFVLMPEENTKNLEKLAVVNRLEDLLKEIGCRKVDAHEIEKEILGSPTFLEENVFSTGHQSVNVYGKPERRYEVRSEDDAVDIQLMEG